MDFCNVDDSEYYSDLQMLTSDSNYHIRQSINEMAAKEVTKKGRVEDKIR